MKTSGNPTSFPNILLPTAPSQLLTEDLAIRLATRALLNVQHEEGYWRFDLESDPGMSADYILMMHYMDEIDTELEAKIATYLREHQSSDGGWPLFYGGVSDLSCAVKAYYALKLAGDHPNL
ncbi:MAG: squalene--hopene cyclase, partial [Nitrospirota bacterium]